MGIRRTGQSNHDAAAKCDAQMGIRWRPRQESNLYLELRRFLFYPLNYRDAGQTPTLWAAWPEFYTG